MSKKKVAAVIASLVLVAAAASASVRERARVEIEVLSDGGTQFYTIPYKEYRTGKTDVIKRYLEARKGQNYRLVITNNTPHRIGAVIAVDGRNIISGKQSDLRPNESMYVLNPHERQTYGGWRTDRNTVHRFYFTDPGDSYAVRTFGDDSSMGVIAVTVFKEKSKPRRWLRKEGRTSKPPAAAAPEALGEDRAGTGFGEGQHSPSVEVAFQPERRPFRKILVKYEWRERLCEMGLMRCMKDRNRLWDEEDRYAPYPPNEHGAIAPQWD